MTDEEIDRNRQRREQLCRRACALMGWDYHQSHIYGQIRKIGLSLAVPISLEKLEAILDELDRLRAQKPPPLE